jgi:hypothetical protein
MFHNAKLSFKYITDSQTDSSLNTYLKSYFGTLPLYCALKMDCKVFDV